MKLTKHFAEVKTTRKERRILCGGTKAHKRALRRFNRARRRAGKAICKGAWG